jgi:hypothetical protein
MARKSFAHVCNLNVVFLFIAAFMLVAAFAASAQEAGSVPDYDRPWQHFAQPGAVGRSCRRAQRWSSGHSAGLAAAPPRKPEKVEPTKGLAPSFPPSK